MIINRSEAVDEIIPLFTEYLGRMSCFFVKADQEAWCKTALKNLKKYYAGADRHIFIMKDSHSDIGFACVNKHLRFIDEGFAVAEFYIKDAYGRKRYGRKLAEYVFEQFPGNWEVAVTRNNLSARMFWEKVIHGYTDGRFVQKRNDTFDGCGFLFNNDEFVKKPKAG